MTYLATGAGFIPPGSHVSQSVYQWQCSLASVWSSGWTCLPTAPHQWNRCGPSLIRRRTLRAPALPSHSRRCSPRSSICTVRPPADGRFAFWVDQAAGGRTMESIAAAFEAAPELADRCGAAPTDAELIDALHRECVGPRRRRRRCGILARQTPRRHHDPPVAVAVR